MSHRSPFIAILAFITALAFPQLSAAKSFTGEEFLSWQRSSQDFYIETSIGMAGLIAVQNNKTQQQCLESWYLSGQQAKNGLIIETIREHPQFHPRGVILAMLEKQCGSFTY